MSRTVDLVVAGDATSAAGPAGRALCLGRRVLVVLRSRDAEAARRLRRRLCRAANARRGRLSILTDAEVVCVAGVDAVEAVVIRHGRTRRVLAVNTWAFLNPRALNPSCFEPPVL